MRALAFGELQKNLVVVNREIPTPNTGEVVVRLKAAAFNRRDYFIVKRFKERLETESDFQVPPFIFGSDGAGVITKVGKDVTGWNEGDAVVINSVIDKALLGGRYDGTFAEYIKVPVNNLVLKPENLSFAEAGALPLGLGTAWRIIHQAKLKEGETVFIHGIGGGVALFALQIAHAMGATVIVSSGTENKLHKAKELGATHTLNYKTQNIVEMVKELTGGQGADVVIDGVGATTFQTSLDMAKVQGRVITYGLVSGSDITFNANVLFMKEISVIGADVMYTQDQFEEAMKFVKKHTILPQVSKVYNMEHASLALNDLEVSNQFGKIVIEM